METKQASGDKIILMNSARIERTLRRMAFQLLETAGLGNHPEQLQLIGLNERGYYLAGRMQELLNPMIQAHPTIPPVETILHQLWIKPEAAAVSRPPDFEPAAPFTPRLPESLREHIRKPDTRQQLVLIDDVLFSGQSLAKAFSLLYEASLAADRPNELRIRTAILIDRGHRRFPVYPELLGMRYPTKFNEHIEAQLPPAFGHASVVLLPEFRHQN